MNSIALSIKEQIEELYSLEYVIAKGTYGSVYAAKDAETDDEVVLKFERGSSSKISNVLFEANLLMHLSKKSKSLNTPKVLGFGQF